MLRVLICVVTVGLAIAACGGHDKAGGTAGSRGETIRIALRDGTTVDLDAYAAAVRRLGPTPTRVTFRPSWRGDEADPEGATVADVRNGRLPFAVVSARVFDTLGVTAFAPFMAPLAIDSLEAERRVLESGLADRALPALDKLGVVGVAVLPGHLRHPVGITRPLVRREDFRGTYIGVRRSGMATRTFVRLGATAGDLIGSGYSGFDGVEADLRNIEADRVDVASLAADLTLWPRVLVVIANPKAWDSLDPRRRKALRAAAGASLPTAMATIRHDDAEAYDVLCRRGTVSFARATAADVAALRSALAPVSAGLDPGVTREIARLRAEAGPPPAHPVCRPPARAQPGKATPVDGGWEFDSDPADLRAAKGSKADMTPENYGHYVFAFSRGRWAYTQEAPGACTWAYGTYSVRGHRMTWDVTDGGGSGPQDATNRPGEHFDYTWSRFKDTLEVGPVRGKISPTNFSALAWRRTGGDARRAPLSRRCPPPPVGLQF